MNNPARILYPLVKTLFETVKDYMQNHIGTELYNDVLSRESESLTKLRDIYIYLNETFNITNKDLDILVDMKLIKKDGYDIVLNIDVIKSMFNDIIDETIKQINERNIELILDDNSEFDHIAEILKNELDIIRDSCSLYIDSFIYYSKITNKTFIPFSLN